MGKLKKGVSSGLAIKEYSLEEGVIRGNPEEEGCQLIATAEASTYGPTRGGGGKVNQERKEKENSDDEGGKKPTGHRSTIPARAWRSTRAAAREKGLANPSDLNK